MVHWGAVAPKTIWSRVELMKHLNGELLYSPAPPSPLRANYPH